MIKHIIRAESGVILRVGTLSALVIAANGSVKDSAIIIKKAERELERNDQQQ